MYGATLPYDRLESTTPKKSPLPGSSRPSQPRPAATSCRSASRNHSSTCFASAARPSPTATRIKSVPRAAAVIQQRAHVGGRYDPAQLGHVDAVDRLE